MNKKIKIHNLPQDKKENIKEGILLTTGLAGGVGVFAAFGSGLFSKDEIQKIESIENNDIIENEETVEEILEENINYSEHEYIEVESSMEVADLSEFTFSEAFKGARAEYGPGGVFEYNGHTYTTYYKEEVEAMSDEEVLAYSNQFESTLDPSTITIQERTDPIIEETTIDVTNNDLDSTAEAIVVEETAMETETDEAQEEEAEEEAEVNEVDHNNEVLQDNILVETEKSPVSEESKDEINEIPNDTAPSPIDLSEFEDEAFHSNIELPESSAIGANASGIVDHSEIHDFSDDEFGSEITESSLSNNAEISYAEIDFKDFDDAEFADTSDFANSSQGVEQEVYFADADLSEFNDPAFDEILEISDTTTEADRSLIASDLVDLKDFEDVAFGDGIQNTDSSFSEFGDNDVIVDASDFNDPFFDDAEADNSIAVQEDAIIDLDDSTLSAVVEPSEIIEIDPSELEVVGDVSADSTPSNINDPIETTSNEVEVDDFDDDLFDEPGL